MCGFSEVFSSLSYLREGKEVNTTPVANIAFKMSCSSNVNALLPFIFRT